jgi:hypothetical protein
VRDAGCFCPVWKPISLCMEDSASASCCGGGEEYHFLESVLQPVLVMECV